METALGILGWSPSEFWNASITEYSLAVRGYCRKSGVPVDKPKLDSNWLAELEERAESGKA